MALRPRLWVVDPSIHRPENEGLAEILLGWEEGSSRLFRPGLQPGECPVPQSGYDTDGVVVMGSASSVHEEPPAWLQPLGAWLGPILRGEVRIPLLGICFGHQLVAHLAGGRVGWVLDDRSRLRGVAVTRLCGGRLLPGPQELRVVISHREEVKRIPAGYRVVASRPEVDVDGMEHEHLEIFSFQFHPEGREEFAAHAEIPPEQIDDRVRRDGRRLLSAFRERVAAGCTAGRRSRGG